MRGVEGNSRHSSTEEGEKEIIYKIKFARIFPRKQNNQSDVAILRADRATLRRCNKPKILSDITETDGVSQKSVNDPLLFPFSC